ncbi:hypothetical protein ACMT1E_11240 [Sphingomonas flavalba]|uniref:hypothetical protein n=1 Tax=Sphingomonas flavalba TaxID=2559804 RepID=UPI0039DFC05D
MSAADWGAWARALGERRRRAAIARVAAALTDDGIEAVATDDGVAAARPLDEASRRAVALMAREMLG